MNTDMSCARSALILQEIERLAATVLESAQTNLVTDEPLGNLGFDSASLKLFAKRITEHFGHPVDTVTLFTFPTLGELADHLSEEGAASGRAQEIPAAPEEEIGPAQTSRHDVAIVGLSCRLPGAANKEAFWENQRASRNAITEIPRRRWNWRDIHGDPLREDGRTDVKWGAFIEDEERFAPEFFGISQYEAECMDPQHRLFLMSAWEAIWDSGRDPSKLAGQSLGVFAGVQFQDYQKLLDARGLTSAQACTGNAHAMIANRVSFLLDVNGPSAAIDTACSSSLVAIHNAVQAIRHGECDMALAGGVNLLLSPDMFIMGRQLGVLSPAGQCRTFDAKADGYVRGEGVGVLLLKPYGDALRDRDHIYGVIRGSAVNHGGKAASLTAPNSRAQAQLMQAGLRDAGMTPNEISYVEMHGTGTELGDPIEIEAVKSAFRASRTAQALAPTPCAVGSVKTNIGHLEPAAGVAGVINVVMAMRHRMLPGLSNFQSLNPHIVLTDGLTLQAAPGPWPVNDPSLPLAGIVNSFGFGGANASLVIQEHQTADRVHDAAHLTPVFVPLAAPTMARLTNHAAKLADAIGSLKAAADPVTLLADIAFTLQQRGEKWPCRILLSVSSLKELEAGLEALRSGSFTNEAIVGDAATAARLGLPEHVSEWLDRAHCAWPDMPDARRLSLPIAPWPDRKCWFEPRPSDEQPSEHPHAELIYLEPSWTEQPADPQSRNWQHKCMWVIGRSDEQLAAFVPDLERECAGKASVVTSVFHAPNAGFQPSLDVWHLSGAEPEVIIILPSEGKIASAHSLSETELVFALAKELMDRAFGREIDVFYVAPEDFGVHPALDAIPALAKSAFLENEHLRIHTLYPGQTTRAEALTMLMTEINARPPASPVTVRYSPSRSVLSLSETTRETAKNPAPPCFCDGGVYLIPGGAGELGLRLLKQLGGTVEATFIVCGRTSPERGLHKRIQGLATGNSSRFVYLQCDITDGAQTRRLIEQIVKEHGHLDGVLNLVTAHNDAYLFRKSWQDFARVAASKVQGTVNLDQATSTLKLDFFMAFSSLASLGLAGGSDYAYGCAFQNAFTTWRAKAVSAGHRHGQSKSLCWSRWKWDKYVTPAFDAWFENLGFTFIDLNTGMTALQEALIHEGCEILILHGAKDRIWTSLDRDRALLRGQSPHTTPISPDLQPIEKGDGLSSLPTASLKASTDGDAKRGRDHEESLERLLITIICDLLKIETLDANARFSAIGLDSVMAIRLIVLIDKELGYKLTPKELLRHQSVAELAAFLGDKNSDNIEVSPSDDNTAAILIAKLKAMLRSEDIAADARFAAIGVDSIMAVKLAAELKRQFNIGISPQWFVRYPSVDSMAEEIERCRSERV